MANQQPFGQDWLHSDEEESNQDYEMLTSQMSLLEQDSILFPSSSASSPMNSASTTETAVAEASNFTNDSKQRQNSFRRFSSIFNKSRSTSTSSTGSSSWISKASTSIKGKISNVQHLKKKFMIDSKRNKERQQWKSIKLVRYTYTLNMDLFTFTPQAMNTLVSTLTGEGTADDACSILGDCAYGLTQKKHNYLFFDCCYSSCYAADTMICTKYFGSDRVVSYAGYSLSALPDASIFLRQVYDIVNWIEHGYSRNVSDTAVAAAAIMSAADGLYDARIAVVLAPSHEYQAILMAVVSAILHHNALSSDETSCFTSAATTGPTAAANANVNANASLMSGNEVEENQYLVVAFKALEKHHAATKAASSKKSLTSFVHNNNECAFIASVISLWEEYLSNIDSALIALSQQRTSSHFSFFLNYIFCVKNISIRKIILSHAPRCNAKQTGCRPYFMLLSSDLKTVVYSSMPRGVHEKLNDSQQRPSGPSVDFDVNYIVKGDLVFRIYHLVPGKSGKLLFETVINTSSLLLLNPNSPTDQLAVVQVPLELLTVNSSNSPEACYDSDFYIEFLFSINAQENNHNFWYNELKASLNNEAASAVVHGSNEETGAVDYNVQPLGYEALAPLFIKDDEKLIYDMQIKCNNIKCNKLDHYFNYLPDKNHPKSKDKSIKKGKILLGRSYGGLSFLPAAMSLSSHAHHHNGSLCVCPSCNAVFCISSVSSLYRDYTAAAGVERLADGNYEGGDVKLDLLLESDSEGEESDKDDEGYASADDVAVTVVDTNVLPPSEADAEAQAEVAAPLLDEEELIASRKDFLVELCPLLPLSFIVNQIKSIISAANSLVHFEQLLELLIMRVLIPENERLEILNNHLSNTNNSSAISNDVTSSSDPVRVTTRFGKGRFVSWQPAQGTGDRIAVVEFEWGTAFLDENCISFEAEGDADNVAVAAIAAEAEASEEFSTSDLDLIALDEIYAREVEESFQQEAREERNRSQDENDDTRVYSIRELLRSNTDFFESNLNRHSRHGASVSEISMLPLHEYQKPSATSGKREGTADKCVICQHLYAAGDKLRTLPCIHLFHVDCVDEWLQRNKACPVCLENIS